MTLLEPRKWYKLCWFFVVYLKILMLNLRKIINPPKMVKWTQTIRRQFANELFGGVWPFCGVDVQRVNKYIIINGVKCLGETFERSDSSPFLIAVMTSSLNLPSNVDVEYFFIKPDFVGYIICGFRWNWTVCLRTNFSYIFDNLGKIDIVL